MKMVFTANLDATERSTTGDYYVSNKTRLRASGCLDD